MPQISLSVKREIIEEINKIKEKDKTESFSQQGEILLKEAIDYRKKFYTSIDNIYKKNKK